MRFHGDVEAFEKARRSAVYTEEHPQRPGVTQKTWRVGNLEFMEVRLECMDCRCPYPDSPIFTDFVWDAIVGHQGVICTDCALSRLGTPLRAQHLKVGKRGKAFGINAPWLRYVPELTPEEWETEQVRLRLMISQKSKKNG